MALDRKFKSSQEWMLYNSNGIEGIWMTELTEIGYVRLVYRGMDVTILFGG